MTSFHAINSLFDALSDAVVPNSCDVVVLDGAIDPARLRRAIEVTLAEHPVLAHDEPIDLRFHHLEHDRASLVDAHLVRFIWDEPFAPGRRPIRFHVTETPTRTYFQTIHTHVFADSTACYTITQQIAAAYAARAPVAKAPGERPELFAKKRERLALTVRAAAQTARNLATEDGGLALPAHRGSGRRKIARFVFSAGETEELRVAARARGRTLHGFFQLAFLRAATSFNRARGVERPSLRLWDFFSMRPAIEKSASPFYDCLALVYPVDLDARWTDEEALDRCTRTVEAMRSGDLAMHAARIDALSRAFDALPRAAFTRAWPSLFKSNVFFTNPGVCPTRLERFGDVPVLDYVTFPQLFAPADVMFVFSTFRDRLRVLVIYDEDALEGTLHADLLEPFLRHLGALAGIDCSRVTTRDGFVASWTAARVSHEPRELRERAMKATA